MTLTYPSGLQVPVQLPWLCCLTLMVHGFTNVGFVRGLKGVSPVLSPVVSIPYYPFKAESLNRFPLWEWWAGPTFKGQRRGEEPLFAWVPLTGHCVAASSQWPFTDDLQQWSPSPFLKEVWSLPEYLAVLATWKRPSHFHFGKLWRRLGVESKQAVLDIYSVFSLNLSTLGLNLCCN